jgi:hypothetical protein
MEHVSDQAETVEAAAGVSYLIEDDPPPGR